MPRGDGRVVAERPRDPRPGQLSTLPQMAAAEEARLRAVGERYVTSMMVAAESNCKLKEWKLAKRQFLALSELGHLLTPEHVTTISRMLALPEMMSAGLLRKARMLDGNTRWVFDDEGASDEPLQGVQSDKRSVCPLVRTPSEMLDAALQLAGVGAGAIVADLGCGDGRLLLRAARLGAHAIGFDVNSWCIERSRAAASSAGLSALVEVIEADMFALDAHPRFLAATVVYVYLVPRVIARLQPLLLAAVARGQQVVIYCTTGAHERPGNELGELRPAALAMGGLLRLYRRHTGDGP